MPSPFAKKHQVLGVSEFNDHPKRHLLLISLEQLLTPLTSSFGIFRCELNEDLCRLGDSTLHPKELDWESLRACNGDGGNGLWRSFGFFFCVRFWTCYNFDGRAAALSLCSRARGIGPPSRCRVRCWEVVRSSGNGVVGELFVDNDDVALVTRNALQVPNVGKESTPDSSLALL